mgnify:FL=1
MSEFYLGKLDVEAISKLKDKAYKGKSLDVAIYINDVDHDNEFENWRAISIKYGNKNKGEEEVFVGNAKKYTKDNPPF